ncbi:hypothetical protein DPMN_063748 [Dreissena polymorpha]|uniref:Uncharacterized protein n=1 Tax=Dreissena polymorpha TaxID=45954 RepID=A0A9D4CC61_DREPO|nr:hypothetical protein DPMN_063748 [Dreissena polymorpha]
MKERCDRYVARVLSDDKKAKRISAFTHYCLLRQNAPQHSMCVVNYGLFDHILQCTNQKLHLERLKKEQNARALPSIFPLCYILRLLA